MLNSVDLAMYIIFGTATITLCSLIALTFISSKELRQHPSGLIMSISICEVIMAYHSIVFAIGSQGFVDSLDLEYSLRAFGIPRSDSLLILCGLNQVVLSGATVACINYNIAVCMDLIITLYNPLIPGNVRQNWYHGLATFSVIYFTVYLNVLNKFFSNCESNERNRLEVLNTGSINILLVIYLCIAVISIVYAMYRWMYGLKIDSEKFKVYLKRHVMYVSVFILCWTFPAISFLIKKSGNEYTSSDLIDSIAIGTTSSSGFFLGLMWISDPVVRSKIRHLTGSHREEPNQSHDAWTQPVSMIVQSALNAELTQCIFRSLHTSYLELKSSVVDFDDIEESQYTRKNTHKVTEGMNEMQAWGVKDPKLKGVHIEFFASEIFLDIINKSGFTLDSILHSLNPENNSNNSVDQSSGKSGSFFLFINDKRLSIKTIKAAEKKTMLKFLKQYHTHVVTFPKSLLCRILGLFSISIPGVTIIDVILMQNVFYGISPVRVYDIKGSTAGRTSKKRGRPSGPLKDLDFIEMKERLYIRDEDIEILKFHIIKDVKLLKENNLMDYSMLIATSECVENAESSGNKFMSLYEGEMYTLGIIDFLTEYGSLKTIERNLAVLRLGKKVNQVSVANPSRYSNRFYNFIFSVVVPIIKRNSSYVISNEGSITE